MEFVNLKKQYKAYKQELNEAVLSVMENGHFILGSEVEAFEQKFKKYTGAKYAVSCANGTDALWLALKACGINRGDEVLIPSFTFIAPANMAVLAGANPVFTDIQLSTFNIDPADVEKKITKKTKAIIAVHLFGHPADITKLKTICGKHGLMLIEDCAQAFGAKYKNRHVGTFGDCGCFSFFPAKNLGAYGDGGMVISNKKSIYNLLLKLRSHGYKRKYYSDAIGINSRLDTLQAAILQVKLKKFNNELARRRHIAKYYNKNLSSKLISQKPAEKKNCKHSYNYYTLLVNKRSALQNYLKMKNVPTMIYYPLPCHLQRAFAFLGYKKNDFPIGEKACQQVLTLPMSGFITKKEQNLVIKTINQYV